MQASLFTGKPVNKKVPKVPYDGRTRDPKPDDEIIRWQWMVRAYLHYRIWLCPSCTGLSVLDPGSAGRHDGRNWTKRIKLSKELGLKIIPDRIRMIPMLEVVPLAEASLGTVNLAIGYCIYCGYATRKGELAAQMRKQRDSGLIGAAIEGLHVRREGYYYRHPTGAEVLAYPRANKLEFHVPVGVAQQGLKLRERLLEIYGHQGKYESMDDDPMLKILLDEDYEDDGETTILQLLGIPG